jgi:hypothetical protein
MGFSIYYRSTRPVSPEEAVAIPRAAEQATTGRTWLSCEPVHFLEGESEDGGQLFGGSKPNFSPHPDDAASAASEGLPDGDIQDLFDVLCQLSRDHNIDWEIGHDHEPGPIGYIRDGVCDPRLRGLPEALADLARLIGEFEHADPLDEDEGEDPGILRLRGDS